MKRTGSRTLHVVPQPSGGWVVRGGETGPSQTFSTQSAAVQAARNSMRATGGELRIHTSSGRLKDSFTLGRAAMERINAIEGVTLSPDVRRAFERFDRDGLSSDQRRERIRAGIAKAKP